MSECCNCGVKKFYKFDVNYVEERSGIGSKFYRGQITLEAYNREEAIEQFKERRWTLQEVSTSTMFPMGKDCKFTVEPV